MERTLEVAQLDIEDVKLVVIFVDRRPAADLYEALQRRAKQAGFEGSVVAVWPDEFGRTRFLAPREQHEFFQVAGYDQLRAQISGTLSEPLA
jgi:hypothetical protein